ncbi:hypothetical protein VCHENC02_3050A, partial [Vibrio harveyi]
MRECPSSINSQETEN